MRNLTICSGILALSFLAAPAKADPTDNTVFAVFGDFDGDEGGGGDFETFSFEGTGSELFIVNLAMVDGTFEDFMGLSFNEIDLGEMDLTGFSYFILGHVTGSEHLILSADGEGAALDDAFEDMLIDGVRNMDGLDPTLGDPGGAVFVSPEDFESFFGTGVDTFTSGTGDIPFDTVGLVGGETDLLGFSDPVLLGTLTLNGDLTGNTFTPAPEPGLALLAVVGLAGAAISRRRRRAA